jgi:hypothetical protein
LAYHPQVLGLAEDAAGAIKVMQKLLNTFNPRAVRLPPEVLTSISLLLPAVRDLFAVSQVCRHWQTIVVLSPPLWRYMDCQNLGETIIGLKHYGSLPLRLELGSGFLADALAVVLDNGGRITSVLVLEDIRFFQIHLSHPRLMASPLEELMFFCSTILSRNHYCNFIQRKAVDTQHKFTSLQKCFLPKDFLPINSIHTSIAVQNLIHLSLETSIHGLDMLWECLELETMWWHMGPHLKHTILSLS